MPRLAGCAPDAKADTGAQPTLTRRPSTQPQPTIAQRVVESILAQKLAPGERLGEQELADMFGVSRTLVREALMQLQARGFVEVRSRKGWYVVEPSIERGARRLRGAPRHRDRHAAPTAGRAAADGDPPAARAHRRGARGDRRAATPRTRTFLLADFHVCLAECLGHRLLADVLRDLTARTTLVASLYQTTHDARAVVRRPRRASWPRWQAGDAAARRELMLDAHRQRGGRAARIGRRPGDARERLRATLAPLRTA